jgi:hypothetical protein
MSLPLARRTNTLLALCGTSRHILGSNTRLPEESLQRDDSARTEAGNRE